jgi:hypothetical protein
MWADATYGTLSSNRERVFCVEDLGLELEGMPFHAVLINGRRARHEAAPKPYNRLAAYDVGSGKLAWHIGGSPEVFGLPQSGAFFLGPPLPLSGRLYAIAELMGEIRLLALEEKTGKLLWSQQLAATDQPILKEPLRRMAGVSPSYADGVLVCPTSNRSIVAVDLATRSLLWGYAYRVGKRRAERQMMFPAMRTTFDASPVGRWTDSSLIVAEGCVLATPVESDELHCLNLIDGKPLWAEPRQRDLYLACVYEGKAVLVGESGVRALRLHENRGFSAAFCRYSSKTIAMLRSNRRPEGVTVKESPDIFSSPSSSIGSRSRSSGAKCSWKSMANMASIVSKSSCP